MNETEKMLREALQLLLDQVDYTRGNCRVNEMVGAVLPKEVIERARDALRISELTWVGPEETR